MKKVYVVTKEVTTAKKQYFSVLGVFSESKDAISWVRELRNNASEYVTYHVEGHEVWEE